jgi:GPN-loop GTPase
MGRRYLDPDPLLLAPADNEAQEKNLNKRFHSLNRAIVQLVRIVNPVITDADMSQIEENPLVSFLPLDLTITDSIERIISHIDYVMQYGEDEEPKEVSL